MLERYSSRGKHSDRLRANSAHHRSISRVTYAPIAGMVSQNQGGARVRSMGSDWGPGPRTAESGFQSGASVTWPTCTGQQALAQVPQEIHTGASTSNFHCNPHREMAIPCARRQQNPEEVTERP